MSKDHEQRYIHVLLQNGLSRTLGPSPPSVIMGNQSCDLLRSIVKCLKEDLSKISHVTTPFDREQKCSSFPWEQGHC